MDKIQTETQKQAHLKKMIEIENKEKKIQEPLPPSLEEIEAKRDEKELKEEEEKSRILNQQMISDIAASNIQLPPSFLKVQKNNESKLNFEIKNILVIEIIS